MRVSGKDPKAKGCKWAPKLLVAEEQYLRAVCGKTECGGWGLQAVGLGPAVEPGVPSQRHSSPVPAGGARGGAGRGLPEKPTFPGVRTDF